jgi:hypothetical protein
MTRAVDPGLTNLCPSLIPDGTDLCLSITSSPCLPVTSCRTAGAWRAATASVPRRGDCGDTSPYPDGHSPEVSGVAFLSAATTLASLFPGIVFPVIRVFPGLHAYLYMRAGKSGKLDVRFPGYPGSPGSPGQTG